jgi:hypothetical protein
VRGWTTRPTCPRANSARILDEREARLRLRPLGSTPEEFAATIAKDLIFWRDAITITGIREK